ncbi:PEP-CTERM domain protein [Nodularia spumigena CENA596]|uniref:PEP-CTERM domain protein n=2 Tax=Nodularia spumigena TaxID=70799 RepID=A0A166I5M6_NODSP|nr:PEP-CTERM domain protein [Nodularia spumigena CENA596]
MPSQISQVAGMIVWLDNTTNRVNGKSRETFAKLMTKNSITTISKILAFGLSTAAVGLMSAQAATAATFDVNFTQLAGSINTGANTNEIGIFRANLSGLGSDLNSILFQDSNNLAGLGGQFSGFDLDSIKLSTTLINNATDINTFAGLNVFDFSAANTIFTPGNQRTPTDPALFGSDGGTVNNTVATLGSFDGSLIDTDLNNNDPTDLVGNGFVSLGDGGSLLFNLTSAVSTNGPLYLYVGEVGNNGEFPGPLTATVADVPVDPQPPVSVPEPASIAALSLMGIYFASRRRQTTKPV